MNEMVTIAEDGFTELPTFPFETDAGIGARANIALIVLASDQTIEHEFTALAAAPGVGLYYTRIYNDPVITADTLTRMEALIPGSVNLLPEAVAFDVVAYGCTSGAMVIGEEKVAEKVRSIRPNAKVTDPVTAMRAAFARLGVTRIGLLTPYLPDVNQALRGRLVDRGLEIPVMGSFHEGDDRVVARITAQSVLAGIEAIGRRDEVEAVFVSCTSLRVVDIVEEAERLIGKPVTSSNHALAWHALSLAGALAPGPGRGRLFHTP